MNQATQPVEEWNVPEVVKWQRLRECLKWFAAWEWENRIVYALYVVCGRVKKLLDLLYKFEHFYQWPKSTSKKVKVLTRAVQVDKYIFDEDCKGETEAITKTVSEMSPGELLTQVAQTPLARWGQLETNMSSESSFLKCLLSIKVALIYISKLI